MDVSSEGNPIKGFPYGFALQIHKRNAVLIVFHEYSMSAVVLRIKRAAAPPFGRPPNRVSHTLTVHWTVKVPVLIFR